MALRYVGILRAFAATLLLLPQSTRRAAASAEDLLQDNSTSIQAIHLSVNSLSRNVVMLWASADNSSRLLLWSHSENSDMRTIVGAPLPRDIDPLASQGGSVGTDEKGSVARLMKRALIKDLAEDTVYQYMIIPNSNGQTSYFRTWPRGTDWSAEMLVLGKTYETSSPLWQKLVADIQERNLYSGIINIGTSVSKHPPEHLYLASATEVSGYAPVFSTMGPYDAAGDVSSYRTTYSTPDDEGLSTPSRLWYSFDISWAHVISFCSEVYFMKANFTEESTAQPDWAELQMQWLEADLLRASSAEQRPRRPWIIAFGSRPLYCGSDNPACASDAKLLYRLEDLFVRYRVNLVIQAEDGAYQRTWPVARGQAAALDYEEFSAPVYIHTNSFSSRSDRPANEQKCSEAWCARRVSTDRSGSYGRLRIRSPHHLQYDEISVDDGFSETIIDAVLLKMSTPPLDDTDTDMDASTNSNGGAVALSILVPVAAVIIGTATAFALCRRRPPYGRGSGDRSRVIASMFKRSRRCFGRGSSEEGDESSGGGSSSSSGSALPSSLASSGSSVAYSSLSYGTELP